MKQGAMQRLAKRLWTPDAVVSAFECGLHQPGWSLVLLVAVWSGIGLLVGSLFFPDSLLLVTLVLSFLALVLGLLLPEFLMFKAQEFRLAAP